MFPSPYFISHATSSHTGLTHYLHIQSHPSDLFNEQPIDLANTSTMPVISRLVSIILRVAEIAFAAVNNPYLHPTVKSHLTLFQVVAGVIGHYLAEVNHSGVDVDWLPQSRWIYTEVIAGLSILLGLIWLIPFSSGFFSWPSTCWISYPVNIHQFLLESSGHSHFVCLVRCFRCPCRHHPPLALRQHLVLAL